MLLDDSRHLRTLAFLYASKGLCSQALTVWRILAKNYSTGLWKDHASLVENESLDSSVDSSSGPVIAATEASKILQESSDEDLILEHFEWVVIFDTVLKVRVYNAELFELFLNTLLVVAILDCRY